jgi:dimethylhistidine N-methyltransferase
MQVSNSPNPSNVAESRLEIDVLLDPNAPIAQEIDDGSDVRMGLQSVPKTLPPRYFYDDRGSQLFEQICELPEYYPTRTEASILRQYADEIVALTGTSELVELGSGSSTKTRLLLDAFSRQTQEMLYLPIDVSGGMLEQSARTLLAEYPSLHVRGLVGTYEQALDRLPPRTLPTRTLMFLGSTIGNLTPHRCQQFLARVSHALQRGEYFLLGLDLQKPKAILEAAYNDARGITAEFNLNMLAHLNRRFQGNFNLAQFQHWAFFNEKESQIEMHLRSTVAQTAYLQHLDLTVELARGETIHTEISRKFDSQEMAENLTRQGLDPVHTWTDEKGWFGVMLCRKSA